MDEPKLNLLLVDDDEDDYMITRAKLRQIAGLDHEVHWVTTYEEAVQALTGGKYALCITDYNLRRSKTGVDLVDEMTQQNCPVPFIVLTGQATLALCIDAGKKGAVDFLDKGALTPSQLSIAIQRALRAARTTDKLRQAEEQLRRLSEPH
jgi:DNA-binding NtrC family response regulator